MNKLEPFDSKSLRGYQLRQIMSSSQSRGSHVSMDAAVERPKVGKDISSTLRLLT